MALITKPRPCRTTEASYDVQFNAYRCGNRSTSAVRYFMAILKKIHISRTVSMSIVQFKKLNPVCPKVSPNIYATISADSF